MLMMLFRLLWLAVRLGTATLLLVALYWILT